MSRPRLTEFPPAFDARRARQRLVLQWAMVFLVVGAIALLALPLRRIPWPARLFTAATDLVMAAVLAILLRQKFTRE